MFTKCPSCSGEGRSERDVEQTGPRGTVHRTVLRLCEQCDGDGVVEAICPVCSEGLDEQGDCRGCQDYSIEFCVPYEKPVPFVPEFEARVS
jgi:hypothetical protein